ncbi:MAG: BadF/BadG/BcrA/BcrD ATPase family protein [Meiothermus sp.]|nr:BadF/BadG/BcrA/BcrD ATPase family protein [Meiothermus sp.]
MNYLGLDAGASSCKWAVVDAEGRTIAEGRSSPWTGHLFDDLQRGRVRAALEELADQVRPYSPRAVVAGVTGLDRESSEAEQLSRWIAELLDVERPRVQIMGDMDLMYRANFEPGEGILVYAGTGSVAYHLTKDGGIVRAGGQGFMIGDEGAGFWIGKTGLRQVLRWLDRGEEVAERPLARHLFEAMGGSSWPRIREYVYGGGRQAVAALAPAVGRAAQDGDAAAQTILRQAGHELAELGLSLKYRLGDLPVTLCGGALRVSPLIEGGARERLELTASDASGALAAARLALGADSGAGSG